MIGRARERGLQLHIQKYLLAGALTVIPIWITWVVFQFFVKQLSKFGMPWVRALSKAAENHFPSLAQVILEPWFQTMTAVVLTLLALYLLGLIATRVIGKRIIRLMDALIERIPFIQTVYGATKKLISALQEQPGGVQRVVLIEFPSKEMKTVGFVTRTMKDSDTGQELAAVYVPTTPNPTSGYLEIVPVERIVSTDWSMDEAMTFIISGGAIAPENLTYNKPSTVEKSE
jgi:uncharacterized membrane protein